MNKNKLTNNKSYRSQNYNYYNDYLYGAKYYDEVADEFETDVKCCEDKKSEKNHKKEFEQTSHDKPKQCKTEKKSK